MAIIATNFTNWHETFVKFVKFAAKNYANFNGNFLNR